MTQLDKPVAQVGAAPAMTLRVGRRVAGAEVANACYFRSGAIPGGRKALLQVTERCDLRCAHCFVSATRRGADMRLGDLATALPRLESARVSTVTLTGGEPFVHPDLLELVTLLTGTGVAVTICTNGVSVTTDQIATFDDLRRTSFCSAVLPDAHQALPPGRCVSARWRNFTSTGSSAWKMVADRLGAG